MSRRKTLANLVEEAIGLAAAFVPSPRYEPKGYEDLDLELSMDNIREMRALIAEVKANTTCPRCLEHCENIERELSELERKYPAYQRINRLRTRLRELYKLLNIEAEEF